MRQRYRERNMETDRGRQRKKDREGWIEKRRHNMEERERETER